MTAIALVACSAAGADPAGAPRREAVHPAGSRPTARAVESMTQGGWKQLPSIAAAVGAAAKADGVAIDAVDAWGERASGCYAVWLALHGASGDAPALADQVLAGLAQARAPRGAAGSKPQAASPSTGDTKPSEHVKPAGSKPQAASPSTGELESSELVKQASSKQQAASPSGDLKISELVKPAGRDGVLSFAFASAPYRGRVRAQLGAGRIDAVACFGNQRAPLACDAACVEVLGGAP